MNEDTKISFPEDLPPAPVLQIEQGRDYDGPRTTLGVFEWPDPNCTARFMISVKKAPDGTITERGPKKILINLLTVFLTCRWWRDCVGFNELSRSITIRDHVGSDWKPLTNACITDIRCWVSAVYGLDFSLAEVHAALESAAHKLPYHPVREYLNSLVWDGEPRLGSWLSRAFGSPTDRLTSEIGRRWLVGAVQRVFRPGSQMDYTLIFKGAQGGLKTTTAQILSRCRTVDGPLSDDTFCSLPHDIESKDTKQSIAGAWIVEIGELNTFKGKEATAIKDFLTRRKDSFRPPYGRVEETFLRQCVFLGTTNEDVFLTDPTGSRRFWVVVVDELDRAWLEESVDQLWAEAVVCFQDGIEPYLPRDLEAMRVDHSENFTAHDPWEDKLNAWLELPVNVGVQPTIEELLTNAIGLTARDQHHGAAIRIGRLMKNRKDYVKRRKSTPGRPWYYVKVNN